MIEIHRINGNIQLFPGGGGVLLVKGSAVPNNHTQCDGVHICSIQAQPKFAGVKMPVVHTEWWKWRQIIFWKVPICPNFVNSACMQISLAFFPFTMLSMGFYKSLKMNIKTALWSTECPDDQAVISFILLDNACTTPPPSSFFLKTDWKDELSLLIQNFWERFLWCVQRLANVMACEANQLQITGQMPLIPLLSGLQNGSRWLCGNDTLNY